MANKRQIENVAEVKDGRLVISWELEDGSIKTSSGNSRAFTTHGFIVIPSDDGKTYKLSMNGFVPRKR